MKKIRCSVFIVLIILVLFFVAFAYVRPLYHFRKQAGVFREYVKRTEKKSLTKVHQRLEMSPSDYQKLKGEVFSSWKDSSDWICPSIDESGKYVIFTEDELNGTQEAYMSTWDVHVPLHLSDNSGYEYVIAVVHDDIVYLEYEAYIDIAWYPFGKVH